MTEPSDQVIDKVDERISPVPDCQPSTSEEPTQAHTEEPHSSTVTTEEPIDPRLNPKVDSETLFNIYLNIFKERAIALNGDPKEVETDCKKLEEIYGKLKTNNQKFLNTAQFRKLMELGAEESVEVTDLSRLSSQHKNLLIELNRLTLKSQRTVKIKNKKKMIEKLTDTIKRLQKEIIKAEHEELDLEDMDYKTSYTDLPKLYRKVEEIWVKREELLMRSTNAGRSMFKKYHCELTNYPDINKCAEKLFNAHLKKLKTRKSKGYVDESFTFIDVRKAILDEINAQQLFVSNADDMFTYVYDSLVKELKKRRQKESEETFETMEACEDLMPENFVKDDPEIEKALASNKCHFQNKLDQLFDKYASEDLKKNGENVLKEGLSEWESGPPAEDNEEFESLDVKDDDLEDDNENSEDQNSDDDGGIEAIPMPEFNVSTPETSEPTTQSNGVTSETNGTVSQANGTASLVNGTASDISESIVETSQKLSETDLSSTNVSHSPSNPNEATSSIPHLSSQSLSLSTSPTITPRSTPLGSPASDQKIQENGEDEDDDSDDEVIDISDSDDEPDSTTDADRDANDNKVNNTSIEVIDLMDSDLNLEVESTEDLFTIDKSPMNLSVNHSPIKRKATPSEEESPVPHKVRPPSNDSRSSDSPSLAKRPTNDSEIEIIDLD